MKSLIAAAAVLLIAACSGLPGRVREPAPPPDQCGSGSLQYLVGTKRADIPQSVIRLNPRIACTTCPVTMDYSATRLNIFYDQSSDVVNMVKCG